MRRITSVAPVGCEIAPPLVGLTVGGAAGDAVGGLAVGVAVGAVGAGLSAVGVAAGPGDPVRVGAVAGAVQLATTTRISTVVAAVRGTRPTW